MAIVLLIKVFHNELYYHFLLFINDMSCTSSPIHSYANDSTLHYSTRFTNCPTQQLLDTSHDDAVAHLTLDLSLISDWGSDNLVVFNASKAQIFHLSTHSNLPKDYPLFFNNTQIVPSSSLNILGVSFSRDFSWKAHIASLAKTASQKLGVLCRFQDFFFTPMQLLPLYRGLLLESTYCLSS